MDKLYERTDFPERLCREYLNTFNMNRRLAKELATAIRGTLVPKKVGKYTCFDHQIWEKGKRTRTHVKRKAADEKPYRENLAYRTLKGDYVRSKSELVLANLYTFINVYSLGIEYTYGPKMILGGQEREADFYVVSKQIEGGRTIGSTVG